MAAVPLFKRGSKEEEGPKVFRHRFEGKDVAVLFIHGFMGDVHKTWGDFPALLEADPKLSEWDILSLGYSSSLWFDVTGLWSASPSIEKLAYLLDTVSNFGDLEDYESIAIVAHSMGGLVVQKALVSNDELAKRVSHLILFGTPSGGLVKASLFKRWKRQIRDMAADGGFIKELRHSWRSRFGDDPPFRFLAVAGSRDEFVPSRSSLEPFAPEHRAVVYGDHLEMVKPDGPDDLSVQVVVSHLVGDAAAGGPWNSARVAVEMRDFKSAIDTLWPHRAELDEPNRVYLALALEAEDRMGDAIQLLEEADDGAHTDAMGVLAGRYKRRWLAEGREADAKKAVHLYNRGLEISQEREDHVQAFYHAINLAFMGLAHRRDESYAQSLARLALHEAMSTAKPDKWSLATEGEAYLMLEQDETALVRYRQALSESPTPREVESMYMQAMRVTDLLGRDSTGERLERLFRPDASS